jgi:glycosyltransferase involved in cell wall biosynthesis|tara:strand:+ start:1116 stop:1964 length:849 start_codon:yes stop_codon:yes gene_type:complete
MLVSIIVITRNHGKYLSGCLQSLLGQSYDNFEIIVVDDVSDDNTREIVESLDLGRVKYFRNSEHSGVARSRNFGIGKASGEYIFFTDADCEPVKNWVQEGVACFRENNCEAVEGKTLAEHQNFGASYHFVENIDGGQYQTCNMAYKKKSLVSVGMFNEKYSLAYEDIDLALRVKREGKIVFCKDMLVFHKLVPWSPKHLFLNARRGKYKVLLVKEHDYQKVLTFRILEVNSLIQVLCPFLIPFYYRLKSVDDLLILPVIYARAVLHRLVVWKTAIEEKIFIL